MQQSNASQASGSLQRRSGWLALLASVSGTAFSPATLVNVPFGLFLTELQANFGWTRAAISLSLSIFIIALIAALPFVGMGLDRFGTRRILIFSIPAYAATLMSLNWLGSLAQLYATFAILGVLSAGAQSLTYTTLLSRWFDKRRGLAIGLCMAGYGIGYIVVPQAARTLITWHGWRGGYVGLGVMATTFAFLPAVAWAREAPSAAPVRSDNTQATGFALRDALQTREFLLLATVFVLASFALNGVQSQLVPLLRDGGMTPVAAILMLSAIGIGSCPGRVMAGYLMDRIFAPRVVAGFFLLSVGGLAILIWHASTGWVLVAAIAVGLSLGAENDALGFMTAQYFGLRSFGRIYSLLLCAYLAGAAVGPVVFAASFDRTGSYTVGLGLGLLAMVAACALLFMLRRRQFKPT